MDSHLKSVDKIKRHLPAVGILFIFLVLAAGIIFGFWLNRRFKQENIMNEMGGEDAQEETVYISHLRKCYLENPIGIDEETPVFNWRMSGEERGLSQSAYRIVVADSPEKISQEEYISERKRVP